MTPLWSMVHLSGVHLSECVQFDQIKKSFMLDCANDTDVVFGSWFQKRTASLPPESFGSSLECSSSAPSRLRWRLPSVESTMLHCACNKRMKQKQNHSAFHWSSVTEHSEVVGSLKHAHLKRPFRWRLAQKWSSNWREKIISFHCN